MNNSNILPNYILKFSKTTAKEIDDLLREPEPVNMSGVTFDDYLPETEQEARNLFACKRFAERFSTRESQRLETAYDRNTNSKGLFLQGHYGTGKTLLTYAILNELKGQGLRGRYLSVLSLFDHLNSKPSFVEANASIDIIARSTCLVLDDILGFEYGTQEWRWLRRLIVSRIQLGLPTVYATNFDDEELASLFGGHLMHLIKHSTLKLLFTGRCRRQNISQPAEEVF